MIPITARKNTMSSTIKHPLVHYQHMLPPELWTMILERLPFSQLFTTYNVSRYMRSLSGPLLARVVATMSPRLFFYQEYVRRIGIQFVFEGVDLERDVVVFRPLNTEHQHRFRNELTLQAPQLEEVTVGNLQEVPQVRRHKQYPHIYIADATGSKPILSPPLSSSHHQKRRLPRNRRSSVGDALAATTTDRIYHHGSNFLDKACPLRAKRTGVATLDGTRHSFGKDYPWRLYYQVDTDVLPAASQSNLHFHDGGLLLDPNHADSNIRRTIPTGGARFIRTVRFECSMNFLNPRRASRNVIGRWIEHKLQQCLRVFGASTSGYPLHYHHHQQQQPQQQQKRRRPLQQQQLVTNKSAPSKATSPLGSRMNVLRFATKRKTSQSQQTIPFGGSSPSAPTSHCQELAGSSPTIPHVIHVSA